MHQGFSDDSMSGAGEKTLLLAACIEKYSVWADFCFSWEAALVSHPSIKYFKMREARQGIKQFDGWKPADREKKIKLLSRVIADYRPKVIVAWVSRAEYDEIVGPIVPYMLRHPYSALFYTLIAKLAEWQYDCAIPGATDFVFDEQGTVGPETVAWYEFMKSLQPPHLSAKWGGTPVFRDDTQTSPLQAADLVAWHKRRRIDNPEEDIARMPTAEIEGLTYGPVHLRREYLVEVATDMGKVPGVDTVHDKPKGYVPGKPPEDIYR